MIIIQLLLSPSQLFHIWFIDVEILALQSLVKTTSVDVRKWKGFWLLFSLICLREREGLENWTFGCSRFIDFLVHLSCPFPCTCKSVIDVADWQAMQGAPMVETFAMDLLKSYYFSQSADTVINQNHQLGDDTKSSLADMGNFKIFVEGSFISPNMS